MPESVFRQVSDSPIGETSMTLLLWVAIGIAVGHIVAGRPLVILYFIGVLMIDMRPLWRVTGAISAVVGGLVVNQLLGSAPVPLFNGLASAWSGLLAVLLATDIQLVPVVGAAAAVLLARAAVALLAAAMRLDERDQRQATSQLETRP
jgi:hypothetical protein